MYVFRADTLAVDKQLMCSSLKKATSPTLSILHSPIVLCVGLGTHVVLPIYYGMFIGVILIQFMLGK